MHLLLQLLCLPLDRFRLLRILRRSALVSQLDFMYLHALHHGYHRKHGNGQKDDDQDHALIEQDASLFFIYCRHTYLHPILIRRKSRGGKCPCFVLFYFFLPRKKLMAANAVSAADTPAATISST